VGIGTAWLTGIALIAAPHRSAFIAIAAGSLIGGAALLGWQSRNAKVCSTGAICAKPAARWMTGIGVLAGFILLYLGYTYV
jgi:mercuric ion transport protein